ncbi:MAG TPA: hypothetical protein VGD22_07860 [Sphingobacteriaceae bacterium]
MENLEFGYWHIFEKEIAADKSLTYIRDYQGQEAIRLRITQLDMTAKEQNQIVNEWCKFLQNEKTSIKKIFIGTRISQKIFDAICMQNQLEGLWIKWGVYPNIRNISKLGNLKYLHLGGGSSIDDISMVESLSQLITFESSHLYKISDYGFLAKLHNIIDLLIEGDPFGSMKKVKIKTLKFLEEMPQIVRLSLSMTSIDDHSYLPILKIKSLKYLDLPNDKDLDKDVHHFEKFLN